MNILLQEYNKLEEAMTQAHISMTACLNSGPVKPPFLNPDRPLTGKPRYYLTGLECGCETLTFPAHKNFDIESYSDGYSEGVAAGMTIMERSKHNINETGE